MYDYDATKASCIAVFLFVNKRVTRLVLIYLLLALS